MKNTSTKLSLVNFNRRKPVKVQSVKLQPMSRRQETGKIINLTNLLPKPTEQLQAQAGHAPGREEHRPYDGNTAFNLYLREVGQTKLLTPEEEVKLAKRIKRGG